jgi:hypothetical protein
MEGTKNTLEPSRQAKEAQELHDRSPDEVKEAARAMERTVRLRRLMVAEPRTYRYKQII